MTFTWCSDYESKTLCCLLQCLIRAADYECSGSSKLLRIIDNKTRVRLWRASSCKAYDKDWKPLHPRGIDLQRNVFKWVVCGPAAFGVTSRKADIGLLDGRMGKTQKSMFAAARTLSQTGRSFRSRLAVEGGSVAALGIKPMLSAEAAKGSMRSINIPDGQPVMLTVGPAEGQTAISISY